MRHQDRRSAPGCQEKRSDRRIGRRSGRLGRRKHCAARLWLPGNPAVCYRPRRSKFIWESASRFFLLIGILARCQAEITVGADGTATIGSATIRPGKKS
jgi:hypothetical protein